MKHFKTQTCGFIALLWLVTVNAHSQTYTQLYGFTPYAGYPPANSDGAVPYCALVLSSNMLFGTTSEGGTNGQGTVFAVRIDGTRFKVLHTFSAVSSGIYGNNSDGAQPYDTLLLFSNKLYGTAHGGGTGGSGFGTVFRINTDGSEFTNLHSFTDGAGGPKAGLILSSNLLYGTTSSGGVGGYGAVFRMSTDGSSFTNIHSFTALTNDGFGPTGGLVVSGSTLYGTTAGGGRLYGGVVFAVGTGGQGYTNLFNFQPVGGESQSSTNNTGGAPSSSLLLLGKTLYGTTSSGGTNGNGVIFAISTNGTAFTNLHTFTAINTYTGTNGDGYAPLGQLLLIGSRIYGTASSGGLYGYGTVFAFSTNGASYSTIYNFQTISSTNYVNIGALSPGNGLILSGSTVYGTSVNGSQSDGNVYALNLEIPLETQMIGGKLVLNWSSSIFSLQSAPALGGSFTNVMGATSPYTNPVSGSPQFFRLQAN